MNNIADKIVAFPFGQGAGPNFNGIIWAAGGALAAHFMHKSKLLGAGIGLAVFGVAYYSQRNQLEQQHVAALAAMGLTPGN